MKNGYALSERLPYGTYVVRETKLIDDKYKIPDFTVEITEDSEEPQTWRVFNDTSFRAVLAIVKQDAETQKTVKVAGAKFKIKNIETGEYFGYWDWNPLPHYVDTWETDETGTVMTGEQLLPNKYQLEEISSPNGYLISSTPVQFEITSHTAYQTLPDGSTPVITIKQKDTSVKGKITVEKRGEVLVDYENGKFIYEEQGLANAKYEIIAREDIYDPSNDGTILYKKGTVVETITTDLTGKATSKALPLGEFAVKEKIAPQMFVISDKVENVSLKYKDQNTEIVFADTSFVNERQKVDINVNKKDYETNVGLAGAEFGLYAKNNILNYNGDVILKTGELIEIATSDSEGKLQFVSDLPLTDFEIKELKSPKGYSSNDEIICVDANYKGQDLKVINLEYEFKNKITKVEISKQDITNSEEIEGAYLTVFEKDNVAAILDTWVSGSDGRNENGTIKPHLIKGLEVGKTYVLRETISPYGFAISQDIEFTVQDTSEIQTVIMKDELVYGKLQFNKYGEIFNQVITGQTEFGKTESPIWNKSNLLGAEITIYANEDIVIGNTTYYKKDEKVQTLKSDLKPVLSKQLPVGSYYYVESVVPFNYIADTNRHYFTIENTQSNELQIIESTLVNERAKFNIDMTKMLEEQKTFVNDEAYKDIVFGIFARKNIYDYMGNVAIKKGTMIATTGITKNGTLENIPDLPNGHFYLKELSTNSQYILNDKEYDFEISYQGEYVSEYTVQIGNNGKVDNKLARGKIEIKKIDTLDENKKIENVVFNLSTTKDMSNIIATEKTNADSIATFNELELGIYYIQEEQAEGYALNDTIYEVEIKQNGDILVINCENKPTEAIFSKVDETGTQELEGATIQIIDKETNEVIEEWISKEKTHTINYLVEGKEYIMLEKTAPYGYELAEEITFVMNDGIKVTMKDMPILNDIKVIKIDSKTKDIIKADFIFGIYEDEQCTKIIKEVKSNQEEGTVLFDNLQYGIFYIKELQSPEDYELLDKIVKVEINDKGVFVDNKKIKENNAVYSFEYANKKIETPKTGDNRNINLLIILFTISTISLTFVVIQIITKKRKKNI